MKTKVLVLLYCFLSIACAQAQLRTFNNLSYKDGLNLGTINCINQSDNGTLWIGTDGAELVSYDGVDFTEILTDSSDNNHHINNINFDGNNVLIASRYKGYFRYLNTQNKYEQININKINNGDALAAIKHKNHYYLIGKKGIIAKDSSSTTQIFSVPEGDPDLEVTQTIESNQALFLLTNKGIFRLVNGRKSTIKSWTNTQIYNEKEFQFGYFEEDKLTLFNKAGNRWLEVILNDRGGFFSVKEFDTPDIFKLGDEIISFSHNTHSNKSAVLSRAGKVYSLNHRKFKSVAHNYNVPLEQVHSIFTDVNGDFWISSYVKGIYKISLEPFTKMQLLSIYEKPNICLPYKTIYGDVIISVSGEATYINKGGQTAKFDQYDFLLQAVDEIDGTYYLASNNGLRIYHPTDHPNFDVYKFRNKNITFLKADSSCLWVGISGEGLHKLNTHTGDVEKVSSSSIHLPDYIYSGELSIDRKYFFFGSNNGIFKLNKQTKDVSRIKTDPFFGSYFGVSTIDKYGTIWFTSEKGIVGVVKSHEIRTIKNPKFFNSYLFYTLIADDLGNLIVGTNKGITLIKVDKSGYPIKSNFYDAKSGYNGYEAFMRSQFKNSTGVLIGTIEGLYMINTSLLSGSKPPLPPQIILDTKSKDSDSDIRFKLKVNNPKPGTILYHYKLTKDDETANWMPLDEATSVINLNNLDNGKYQLEVISSFDGKNFSSPSIYNFRISKPFWKSQWFIISAVAIVLLFNILLMRYYKTFDDEKLMDTKDLDVYLNSTPMILLFASLTSPIAQITAPMADGQLKMHLGLALTTAFVLLALYFLSLQAKNRNKRYLFKNYLVIGFIIVMANFLWEVYTSSLHPFFIIGVALIGMVIPFVINKVRQTILFSLVVFFISICYTIILDDTVYPKLYFLIAMFTMSSLMVFSSYMRYDSLEKLIFISGIINKGRVPAIAFNKKGIVTYASENINHFVDITHDNLVNNNIVLLNKFVPFDGDYRHKDITQEFRDGEKYIVPLTNGKKEVHWIEWSYQDFSSNIKVIIGQDVTSKMDLENTYELLVQNAEDFIYQCDINGNFTFLNDISYQKLGYNKEELIGQHPSSIVPEKYKNEVIEFYETHFKERKTTSYLQFPVKKKDGDIIWLGQYVTTIFSAGSNSYITGYIALARDITDIRKQQKTIIEQSESIKSSINYARRIQYNLLPHESQFSNSFDEHFIISKPKDIVSGDFYWMEKVDGHTILVMADCTGHGVPGSFMTLLGFNLLNSVVLEARVTDPAKILNHLDLKLQEYLQKGESDTVIHDAMEITICVFNENKSEMSYACAGSRFLIYEKEAFTMFKGDNKHIGDIEESFEGYHTHYTSFNSSYNVFLFSDGFQDQFGGPKDKKYSFRRLLELLESNINLPLDEQQKMIEADFNLWIGDNQQTDDVSIISVKRNL